MQTWSNLLKSRLYTDSERDINQIKSFQHCCVTHDGKFKTMHSWKQRCFIWEQGPSFWGITWKLIYHQNFVIANNNCCQIKHLNCINFLNFTHKILWQGPYWWQRWGRLILIANILKWNIKNANVWHLDVFLIGTDVFVCSFVCCALLDINI